MSTDYVVIVLQHPTEAKKKSLNTVLLLKLCLKNCHVCVDIDFSEGKYPVLDEALSHNEHGKSCILYPGVGSRPVAELAKENEMKVEASDHGVESKGTLPRPVKYLVAIDGTWKQAKNIAFKNPRIFSASPPSSLALHKVLLTDEIDEREYLRSEPREHFMSTAHAVCRSLKLLDPVTGGVALSVVEKAFNCMQSIQKRFQGAPKKKQPKHQSHRDFEGHERSKVLNVLELAIAEVLGPARAGNGAAALKELLADCDPTDALNVGLTHQCIIAYPVHNKDQSVTFKRFPMESPLVCTVPEAKSIVGFVNCNLNRSRGHRLTTFTKHSFEKVPS